MDTSQFNAADVVFSLTMIILPFVLGTIHAWIFKSSNIASVLLSYYVVIGVGIQGLVTGFVQVFKSEWVIAHVHWAYSEFLIEVGMANLSYGFIGILSIWMGKGWRNAAGVGYALFFLFTGFRHIVDIVHHGFYAGDSGAFVIVDFFIPLIIFVLLGLQNKPNDTI